MARAQLGFWDTLLYAVVMNVGLRAIAAAGTVGPPSLAMWVAALVTFFLPLAIAAVDLTSRFEGSGGLYIWTREAFGPFAGFMCGWIYWTANLPFFSSTLYSIVTTAALIAEGGAESLTGAADSILAVSAFLALVVLALQIAGFGVGKWLTNLGAIAVWSLLALVLVTGIVAASTGEPATKLGEADYSVPLTADSAILWGMMIFAFCGAEAMAFLRNDVQGGVPTIVRAILILGGIIAVAYVLGTAAVLTVIAPDALTRIAGFQDALRVCAAYLGIPELGPFAIAALALAILGNYSAWFGAAAQLPLAAGVDRYLPSAFGRRHPKTGAPIWALVLQATLAVVLVAVSQAGTGVQAAYDFLLSMTVLTAALPYLFVFAVYFKVQGDSLTALGWKLPGGPMTGRAVALLGISSVVTAIVCTLVPSVHEAHPLLAIGKLLFASLVLVGAGVVAYTLGRRRAVARITSSEV